MKQEREKEIGRIKVAMATCRSSHSNLFFEITATTVHSIQILSGKVAIIVRCLNLLTNHNLESLVCICINL